MTKQEMETLVQSQLDAYNRRDLEAFCACYHPEVKVNCSGLDQFRISYREFFDESPELYCELRSRVVL